MDRSILILAAHPDDEVLGCGGAMAKWADAGARVNVAFLTDGIAARGDTAHGTAPHAAAARARRAAAEAACAVLGAKVSAYGEFPDNAVDTVPLLEVVKFVESQVHALQPGVVITHHAGDLNIDHRLAHQAVETACRPQAGRSVKTIGCFEVPSSTEWRLPQAGAAFEPNWFVDVSAWLPAKMRALECYAAELRDWPHPRSRQAIEHLARWRGATVGVDAAEAFMLARWLS